MAVQNLNSNYNYNVSDVVKQIKEEVSQQGDLTKLFFEILNSDESLRRRDIAGSKDFYYTTLPSKSKYETQLLEYFKESLMIMGKREEKESSILIDGQTAKSTLNIKQIVINSMVERGLLAHPKGYDETIGSYDKNDLKLLPKDLWESKTLLTDVEIQTFKSKMETLKKEKPEIYECCKMSTAFSYVVDRKARDEWADKQYFYVHATVKIPADTKYYETQYVTSYYRDRWGQLFFGPEPREDVLSRMVEESKILLIHQDNFLIKDLLDDIAKVFQNAVLWDKKDVSELQKTAGWFRYKFAHIEPFESDRKAIGNASESISATIGEGIETAIYNYHGYNVARNNLENEIHLEALASPSPLDFLKKYNDMAKLSSIDRSVGKEELFEDGSIDLQPADDNEDPS